MPKKHNTQDTLEQGWPISGLRATCVPPQRFQ